MPGFFFAYSAKTNAGIFGLTVLNGTDVDGRALRVNIAAGSAPPKRDGGY
jgi:hypothetical protein